jgi:hypothetical protein
MISLFVEMMALAVRVAIVMCVLFARAVAWSYREADRLIHQHRVSRNPDAARGMSQLMAGGLVASVLGVLLLIGAATGGESGSAGSPVEASAASAAVVHHKPSARKARAQAASARRQAARARAQRRARAERRATVAAKRAAARRSRARAAAAAAAPSCNENYSGACLDPNASDYDCAGGSGDGPAYTGTVYVKGYDEYDLDADGDGVACDS